MLHRLKAKRTTDRLEARKIPESLKHVAAVPFSVLCADAQTKGAECVREYDCRRILPREVRL